MAESSPGGLIAAHCALRKDRQKAAPHRKLPVFTGLGLGDGCSCGGPEWRGFSSSGGE